MFFPIGLVAVHAIATMCGGLQHYVLMLSAFVGGVYALIIFKADQKNDREVYAVLATAFILLLGADVVGNDPEYAPMYVVAAVLCTWRAAALAREFPLRVGIPVYGGYVAILGGGLVVASLLDGTIMKMTVYAVTAVSATLMAHMVRAMREGNETTS